MRTPSRTARFLLASLAIGAWAFPDTSARLLAAAQVPAKPAVGSPPPAAPDDVAAPPADAERTTSGLATKQLQAGTGDAHPGPSDMVTLNYTGWTTDGKAFDSTATRGRPSTLSLERVMKGLSEGVQLMVVGERRRLWVPEALAFAGIAGRPTGMVVFDVELLSFEPPPTQAPTDVAAPPPDAEKTSSGLAYRVLRRGSGTERPTARSRVTVHYTGWTTDGKMFDSSVARGRPSTFPLNQVIKGWTEGVQLMVTGEKTRFWIPEKLAYQGEAGSPRGMLVFDIELITIDN
jgi:peptidylprolyl isomerase